MTTKETKWVVYAYRRDQVEVEVMASDADEALKKAEELAEQEMEGEVQVWEETGEGTIIDNFCVGGER